MNESLFDLFFKGQALSFLEQNIELALKEDGKDLTSLALFPPTCNTKAILLAKEDSLVCGLRIAELILQKATQETAFTYSFSTKFIDGMQVKKGDVVAEIEGAVCLLLQVERVILNFIMHLSGIANKVRSYVQALEGTGVRLLDTRKTTPALRYPEKYAVLVGGGNNHRRNLEEILMLKDNHIDAAGSITAAVAALRSCYTPTPKIEVECRSYEEAQEAVATKVERIMLDNMSEDLLKKTLVSIPPSIELELSGGIRLENIRRLALLAPERKPDFISVGALTNSVQAADFSMLIS